MRVFITINWKLVTWDYIFFGWHVTMVTKLVTDRQGTESYLAPTYNTLGWDYSNSWYDRLWPMRKVVEEHPQWYNKLMKRFAFRLGRKCS